MLRSVILTPSYFAAPFTQISLKLAGILVVLSCILSLNATLSMHQHPAAKNWPTVNWNQFSLVFPVYLSCTNRQRRRVQCKVHSLPCGPCPCQEQNITAVLHSDDNHSKKALCHPLLICKLKRAHPSRLCVHQPENRVKHSLCSDMRGRAPPLPCGIGMVFFALLCGFVSVILQSYVLYLKLGLFPKISPFPALKWAANYAAIFSNAFYNRNNFSCFSCLIEICVRLWTLAVTVQNMSLYERNSLIITDPITTERRFHPPAAKIVPRADKPLGLRPRLLWFDFALLFML